MKLILTIRVEELRGGGLKPGFELEEYRGDGATMTPFLINIVCDSKKEAERVAKYHASQEIRERYGDDIQVFSAKKQ